MYMTGFRMAIQMFENLACVLAKPDYFHTSHLLIRNIDLSKVAPCNPLMLYGTNLINFLMHLLEMVSYTNCKIFVIPPLSNFCES